MIHTVKAMMTGGIVLNETDPVKAKLQEVAMVLGTIKGSIPMYRDFGAIERSVLDRPMPVAEMIARATIREGIEQWCKGVTVKKVSFQRDEKTGTLIPEVEVEIHEGA